MGRESEWDMKSCIQLTASWLEQPVQEIREIFISTVHSSAKEAIEYDVFTRALVLRRLIACSHNFEQAYVISAICSDQVVKMSQWSMHMGKIFPNYPKVHGIEAPAFWAYGLFSKINLTDFKLPDIDHTCAENLMKAMATTMEDETRIPDTRRLIQEVGFSDNDENQLLCISAIF